MSFKVGQKVVCVSTPIPTKHKEIVPQKDRVYTVRKLGILGGILLVEIINDKNWYIQGFGEIEFYANHFAPIIENTSTSDIANQIFEQHPELKEIKIPELV